MSIAWWSRSASLNRRSERLRNVSEVYSRGVVDRLHSDLGARVCGRSSRQCVLDPGTPRNYANPHRSVILRVGPSHDEPMTTDGTSFGRQISKARKAKALSQKELPAKIMKEEDGTAISTRSEEHTSELQSLMRNSYAVFCLQKKNTPRK